MIYWADRLLWSMACVLAGLVGVDRAIDEYVHHGLSSPALWYHAIGAPATLVGIVRAWTVR